LHSTPRPLAGFIGGDILVTGRAGREGKENREKGRKWDGRRKGEGKERKGEWTAPPPHFPTS